MKRTRFSWIVVVILVSAILAGCGGSTSGPTSTPTLLPPSATSMPQPTDTSTPMPTNTDTPEPPSPTPVPVALITQSGVNLRGGPGTAYAIVGSVGLGDSVTLLGQAENCEWYQIKLADGTTAWLAASTIETNLACGDLAVAEIPPLPVSATPEAATGASGGNPVPVGEVHSVRVNNKTGDTVYLTFVGAQTFNFVLPPGNGQRISLPAGSYTIYYTMCGGQKFYEQGAINANWFLDIKCP